MASIKISELNETTELESNDLFAVVDTVADETKKMSYGSLKTQLIGDNFAVLTGSVANTELTLGGKQLNYPDGFSQSNCTVISVMKKNHTTSVWNCYYSTYNSDEQRNDVGMMAQLFSNVIKLVTPTEYTNERTGPSSESNGYDYRVVLMKIS